jgi:putative ABC transport system permease protein
MSLRHDDRDGVVYQLSPQNARVLMIRLVGTRTEAALAHIESVMKQIAPQAPPARTFLNQVFEGAYSFFALAASVLAGIAAFAVAIAAIGLFGMAAYATRRRTREIGLRKTQGATSSGIVALLLWDFSKPVLIGNLIAWPFAFIAARAYIDLFGQRLPLTPIPFAIALLVSLGVAWVAVGGYAWTAARRSPTEALREE